MARTRRHPPLRVYQNDRLVGQLLKQPSGAIEFRYDRDWLDRNTAFPVSLSLPLAAHTAMSTQALDSERVRRGIRDVLLGPAQLYEALRERGAAAP